MQRYITILICATILAGCNSIKINRYKSHNNPALTPAELAILHIPSTVHVKDIDGKGQYYPSYISEDSPYKGATIELLPGMHRATLRYYIPKVLYSTWSMPYKFIAKEGKEYFLTPIFDGNNLNSSVTYIIHECGGKVEERFNSIMKKLAEKTWYMEYQPSCWKAKD